MGGSGEEEKECLSQSEISVLINVKTCSASSSLVFKKEFHCFSKDDIEEKTSKVKNKLDQVNCAKLKYIQTGEKLVLVGKVWWKFFGEKVFVKKENCSGKFLVEFFGGNAIFDIIEPPAFQKYSIHCVLEALCICLCLCLGVFFFVFVISVNVITR